MKKTQVLKKNYLLLISSYFVRKSIKFKIKWPNLEKRKTDNINMNYLAALSENAQMKRKNTDKSIALPYQISNVYPNHTVTKVMLRWAQNKTPP